MWWCTTFRVVEKLYVSICRKMWCWWWCQSKCIVKYLKSTYITFGGPFLLYISISLVLFRPFRPGFFCPGALCNSQPYRRCSAPVVERSSASSHRHSPLWHARAPVEWLRSFPETSSATHILGSKVEKNREVKGRRAGHSESVDNVKMVVMTKDAMHLSSKQLGSDIFPNPSLQLRLLFSPVLPCTFP